MKTKREGKEREIELTRLKIDSTAILSEHFRILYKDNTV